MDLICLILWIIDLAKPSMPLSVAVLVVSLFELFLLICKNRSFGIAYIISIVGVIIGTYTICKL